MNGISSIFFKRPLDRKGIEGIITGVVAYGFSLHVFETFVGIDTFVAGGLSIILATVILKRYGVVNSMSDNPLTLFLSFGIFCFVGRILQSLLTL